MLTYIDVKFIVDSVRLGLFIALRVVFLLFLPCF